jgi:hypothetical protein
MDHTPMYRASAQRNSAPAIPLRRSVSILSAAAALTLSGIALGYHGLSDTSGDAQQPAQTVNADITIPVPGITFPTVTSGHPDVLAQLSTALLSRLQPVPAAIVALPAPPPPPPAFVAPTLQPFVLSVEVAPADDPAPVDLTEANLDVPQDAIVAPPRVVSAPLQLAARSTVRALEPPAQDDVEVAGVTVEAEPTVEAAAVSTPEPTAVPKPKPAPAKPAAAVHAPTPVPEPKPKAVVKEPTPPPAPARPPERKDPPAPDNHPRPEPSNPHQDPPKHEDPKPQPAQHNNKPSPGKGKGGHGG